MGHLLSLVFEKIPYDGPTRNILMLSVRGNVQALALIQTKPF